ncbi:MAG TPA: glycosyltransferase family 4 protein [Steroidobacteraceae bacterium]|nr:glycosyltransferase family 4 protein [Steroidobacteraceae bacterium]
MNLLVFNLKIDADDDVLGFTTEWVNALALRCEKVFVVTMTAGRIAVADNVTVISVGRELGYSEPRRALRFYSVVRSILREQRIDACFAHMMPLFAVMGWPLLRMKNIPILLWYAHGHIPPMVRVAEKLVDMVLASTASGFQLASRKLQLIGQGIDTGRFSPAVAPASDKCWLLSVGRVSRVKRLDLVIGALALLPARLDDGRELRLKIVGKPLTDADRAHARELAAFARERGVADRVEFVDALPFAAVHTAYVSADVLVNSSETHSADKVVLEAMSCGLVIVTSNVAFRDVLPPDVGAMCMIPGNDAGALAARLRALLELDDAEYAALAARLRAIVIADHSLHALTGKILTHAERLIATRKQAGAPT